MFLSAPPPKRPGSIGRVYPCARIHIQEQWVATEEVAGG